MAESCDPEREGPLEGTCIRSYVSLMLTLNMEKQETKSA